MDAESCKPDISYAIIFMIISCLISFITCGSITVVCVIVLLKRKKNKTSIYFTFNGLIASCIDLSVNLTSQIYGQICRKFTVASCTALATNRTINHIAVILSYSTFLMERYYFICYPASNFKKYFTPRNVRIIIPAIWGLALVTSVILIPRYWSFNKNDTYTLSIEHDVCFATQVGNRFGIILVTILFHIVPFVLLIVIGILLCRRIAYHFQKQRGNGMDEVKERVALSVYRMSFLMSCGFVLLACPLALYEFWMACKSIHSGVHEFSPLFVQICFILTSLYYTYQSIYLAYYEKPIKEYLCQKWSIAKGVMPQHIDFTSVIP